MTGPNRVVHDRRRSAFEVLVEGDQVAGYAEYVPGEHLPLIPPERRRRFGLAA